MQWMLLRPDDHQAESGHDAGIPRRTHETSGRPDGAVSDDHVGADSGFARTGQVLNLQQRVAELEAANTALRAEAERTRLILEGATDYAIITIDLEGRVTGWNEGARRILGYEEAEILGQSCDVWFPPEDRAANVPTQEMCRALEHGRAENERWHLRRDGSRFWASGLMMPLFGDEAQPRGFLNILRDQTKARAEEERRALLLAELNHRVKNTLATVQSIAAQTVRNTGTPSSFRTAFEARLMALARSHDMLTRTGWDGALLSDIVEQTLRPHDGVSDRVMMTGPPVRLAPNAVVTLNLAFHELATNAAKYGALSAPEGHVEVTWTLRRPRKKEPIVEIVWRERGGPPVLPPERRGFGSRLLERGLAQEFGGKVRLDFAPEGVECHICLPLTGRIDAPR
jgi:PAS domain S-box-containing protein